MPEGDGGIAADGSPVSDSQGQVADPASAVQPAAEPDSGELPPADAQDADAQDADAQDADAQDAEPMTMAELLDQPHNEVKSLKHGDVVEGSVVRIDPDEILVDFGGKSEGVVSNRELMSRRGPRDGEEARPELKVGDEVLVYVLQPESPEGHAVLSLRRAGLERKWRAMQERFDAGEIVEARVIDHNKGGLIVDLGVRGFVPISQIVDFPRRPRDEQPRDAAQEIAEKLQPFVGRTLRLKILEVNRKANRLILSEKVALYEERREKRDELFSSLQVGQRVQGTVRSIAPFGVFIDLGGIDGLVHKSELSWNKVNNPETAYAIGDEVEAEVIDINHERGRISLSIRRLQPDPWQESVAKYRINDVIEGTVTKLVNFGAFVRVEEGLEGLIHISELSNQRVAHPGDVVKEGDVLKLKIISLDSERHRLGLSLKQAEERPVAEAAPAPARSEERDRPQRRDRRDRRDRDYRPEDATAEPEDGIDNTMAAAFAESGLLEQFRASQAQREETPAGEPPAAEAAPRAADEAPAAEPQTGVEAESATEPATATEPEASEVEPQTAATAETATEPEASGAEPETGSQAESTTEPANTSEPESPEGEAPAGGTPEVASAEEAVDSGADAPADAATKATKATKESKATKETEATQEDSSKA
ncbi:MAG: 30S ribosomal protein S1 [Chloroflexota bacterium]|nr:30S ribosomal protein S1 [Chloroflexota bacterium]